MEHEKKYALLIDADNISPQYIDIIMRETVTYGIATIRRIYCDWTDTSKESWKKLLLENSLSPIHQYSYTYGKNSSDSAMIIDAMDILYGSTVDGFILVTSDSDFTKLAVRLREAGKQVIGMGESKTPSSFVKACEQFKTLDVLLKGEVSKKPTSSRRKKEEPDNHSEPQPEVKEKPASVAKKPEPVQGRKKDTGDSAAPITSLDEIKTLVLSLLDENSDDEGWMFLGDIGNMIIKRYPDFDSRNYGYKKFATLIRSFPDVTVRSEKSSNGMSRLIYVKRKEEK